MKFLCICLLLIGSLANVRAQELCTPLIQIPFSSSLNDEGVNGLAMIELGVPGTFIADRTGNESCAYRFNGGYEDYILVESSETYNFDPLSDFSISLWYRGGSPDYADPEMLVQHGEDWWSFNPQQMDYFMMLFDINKAAFMSTWQDEPEDYELWMADTTTWHHLVGVYSAQTVSLYMDNVLQETKTLNSYLYNNTGDMLILGKGFMGVMDDLQIFECALTAEDISELYTQETSCISCAADYNGDGIINTADIILLLGAMGCASDCSPYDLTGDDMVNVGDVIVFLGEAGGGCE